MANEELLAEVRRLHEQGLSGSQIARKVHYTKSYVNQLLRDPDGREARRRYWAKRTPLQRATSRLSEDERRRLEATHG